MGEKRLNLDMEPACPTTTASLQQHQLQRVTRPRIIKGLEWVALVMVVLFMLDSAFTGMFTQMHRSQRSETKQSVTEEEARQMLVKDNMRTVIGEFSARMGGSTGSRALVRGCKRETNDYICRRA